MANNAKVLNIEVTDLPYPAYVMLSMTLWQTFVQALNGPISGVNGAKQMLAKISFPQEALILSKLGEVFFNFGIKLLLILGIFIWFRISITWSIIIAPVALIHLIIFGTAIGVFLAPLAALYSDFSRGLTLMTSFWLFITPVIYPIPTGKGIFSTLVNLNPVSPLLVTTRELATTGIVSNAEAFWTASIIAIVGLFLAWFFYRLAMPFVIERMSA